MNKKISGILIRTATLEDIPQILELYKELQPHDPPVDIETAITVWVKASSSGITYFIAVIDGRIIATLYIAIIPNITKQCSPIGFIENIVTAVEYRRMGIGKKLLETAVAYAKSQGCYKVMLQSGIQRTEAHAFYNSIGFDGHSKRAFEIRF